MCLYQTAISILEIRGVFRVLGVHWQMWLDAACVLWRVVSFSVSLLFDALMSSSCDTGASQC